MPEAGEKMKSSLERFIDATKGHVPPEADSIMSEEVKLSVPKRYRVRFRSNDMQFEAVCRFTGFGIPDDNDPSVLILEFVPEFSYIGRDDAEGS
jgi:hypothetical protein